MLYYNKENSAMKIKSEKMKSEKAHCKNSDLLIVHGDPLSKYLQFLVVSWSQLLAHASCLHVILYHRKTTPPLPS